MPAVPGRPDIFSKLNGGNQRMPLRDFKPALFTVEDRPPILIATVTRTSLSEEDNIEQFGFELNKTIESYDRKWLALDLGNVTLLTSSAMGKLIALHRHLHRSEGRLVLCRLSNNVDTVLKTAKLSDYFHIKTNVEDAVNLLLEESSKS